ncbi:hypothetical protein NUU61_008804 [Penicillium alfredii]|uniref:Uncharacterized protein n=1 Tax=Penicillium alfredii TaxID=1506179 RepID=A0A9W9JWN0_9EURO|nr:uncharacterized protein NUU61_008804 [Penicillium alfredii]KAJ5084225.1 hypothetical protein NUU61_008804 [Penicillium alfredii]
MSHKPRSILRAQNPMRKFNHAISSQGLIQESLQTVGLRIPDGSRAGHHEHGASVCQRSDHPRKSIAEAAVGGDKGHAQFLGYFCVALGCLKGGGFVAGIDEPDLISLRSLLGRYRDVRRGCRRRRQR